MAANPAYVGNYRTEQLALVPEFGTRPRVLWRAPSDTALRGSRIHAMTYANSTGSARTVDQMLGKVLSKGADMGTPAIAGLNAITRDAGSFIADGWRVGQRLALQGATTVTNDALAIITAVTATQISFAASTFSANENLPSTIELIRVTQLHTTNVAASSGFADGSPSVSGLNNSMMPAIDQSPGRFLTLGSGELLLARINSAAPANTAVEITAFGGDY
ncbi:MAG: hypothetical protein HZC25_08635 [Rhodospirillales bacterium]|nr:hypothetical protein [Rhodospirillales bacterium]